MIEIARLSTRYDVRCLTESDVDEVFELCRGNTQFYQYCEASPTREQVLNDMRITPPGIAPSHKYYVGFYRQRTLVAVMDLIDGYPEPKIAYIGFFMMNSLHQGKQIGSSIIGEAAQYLKGTGKRAIRLAIDKANPQSTHFWKKNGFTVLREIDRGDWTILEAEMIL